MGKKIKIAIARMMAVLMVMTLIPFDMLAPAIVAKAATATENGVTTTVTEDEGKTEWDFTGCSVTSNTEINKFTNIGGLCSQGTGVKANKSKYLEIGKSSVLAVPLQAGTTAVTLSMTQTAEKDGYLQIASVKVYSKESKAGQGDKFFSGTNTYLEIGTFGPEDFTQIEGANYLCITASGSAIQVGKICIVETAGTVTPTAKAPTPDVESGTEVIEGTKLTLTSATEGASIYYTYTNDGSEPADPTAGSTPYPEGGIVLNDVGTIKIKAIAISGTGDEAILSKVVTFTYTVKEETILEPEPSIVSGTKVQKDMTLALETKTEGAEIYYTLNGDVPAESSTKYDGAFSLGSEAGEVTVKAIAIKGTKKSPVVEFTYTITGDKLAAPTADRAVGEVARGTKVTLSYPGEAVEGVVIYYTTDGSTPSESSAEYKSPIEITKDMEIKAIAMSESNADSDVATFKYTIKKPKLAIESGSAAILSSAVLQGDITFKNASEEIFDIEIKAEKDNAPTEAVKTAAEACKNANGGEIIYYNISLVNKENISDTVSVVKGAAGADGVVPGISVRMPYSIASSEVSKLNEIIVLHGTEKVTSVGKEAEGFTFSMDEAGSYAVIVNPRPEGQSLIDITESAGYEEGAYAEWKAVEGADGYMAYVATAGGKWTRIDDELIREYKDYWRVDTVGLAKGNYFIKIDAVTLSDDKTTATVIASDTTEVLKVTNYDRTGFAFSKDSPHKTGSGAYKEDGTLLDGALVLYVNNDNFNTISVTVKDAKGNDVTFTGIQAIVGESGVIKAAPTTPIDIRIIGTIDTDKGFPVGSWGSSSEGLQIKSKKDNRRLTIEGIGEDAAVNGFGFLIRSCGNVELRNFAVMNFKDDGVSIDTNNCNLWIHDLDIFYGKPGGDSDQAKGDGSVDIKKSQYCTVSYNHFWDSGKCCLIDASAASSGGADYLTYHHNWFDHSDSRHPRIRNGKNFHIYNNYYDGNSKYGAGVTTGSSAFVESNYFRNCNYPMLSSKQGSDIPAGGIFSGEAGGIIKAYGNYMEGQKAFVPYSAQATADFDAYVVNDPGTQVPASVKTKVGNTSYSNFDTADTMYSYVADTPEEAKEKVVRNAGRLNGGDLQWTFDNATEDKNYAVIPELKAKVVNYQPSVKAIGGKVEGDPQVVEMPGGGSTNVPAYTPKNVSAPEANLSSRQVAKNTEITLSCATAGASIYYTLDGSTPTSSSTLYTDAIVITESTTVKAIAVCDGEQSDVSSYKYTVVSEGTAVDPGPGGDDKEKFETRTYMFNPEASEMAVAKLPADVTQYGTDGYFTIDNAEDKAAISLISSNGNAKDAPAGTHGTQEEYTIRYSFGDATTKDSKQAIRFTAEYAAKVYIGAYVSNADAGLGKKIYLDSDENATASCVNASTEYSFDVEAGDHVIYAKDGNVYILYVVVEERVPIAPSGTVATPVASRESGDVVKNTKITLICNTEGARIHYTLDGTVPTAESPEYTEAIDLGSEEKTVTLKAVAVKDGISSTVAEYTYSITGDAEEITVTNPVASQSSGEVPKGTEVTLSSTTAGAKIYYTLDGTNPTAESEEYKNSPIVINETVTIKAIAIKGENTSEIVEFTYMVSTVNPPQVTVSSPVASPAAGAVAKGTKIGLTSATAEAKIYYTTDKTEPTANSELYTEPILITEAMTIKAIAVKEGCKDSEVVTFAYTVTDSTMEQAKAPKATPGTDAAFTRVAKGTEVKLSSVTAEAKIYYTTDGTVPSKNSTLYDKAIVIEEDTTIKAIAVKEGFADSAVATFTYKVLPDDVDYGDIIPEDIEELIEKYEASTDKDKTLIPDGLWIAGLSSGGYVYSGSSIRPEVRVYNKNVMLREKADYTISYKNNLKANASVDVNADQKTLTRVKAPMVTVTGKGNYSGKEVAAFRILPLDISDDEAFEADEMSFADIRKAKTQIPILYWNGKSLKKKTDYVVAGYYKQKDITDMEGTLVDSITEDGDYLVELEGKGNFTGTRKVEWHVDTSRKLISSATVAKIPDQAYTRGGATPLPVVSLKSVGELHQGSDYLVSYSNNTQPGVAYVIITGIGEYTGTKRVAFKVLGTPLKGATVEGLEDRVYNGDEQELDIDVVLDGARLIEGDDYTVTYSNNVKAGKAVVTITGINAYFGVIKKNFRIKAYNVADELIKGASDIKAKYMKGGAKPALHLTFEGMALREGVDYSVTYKNNKAYPAVKQPQLVIKGKGNFTGTKTVDFTIEAKTLRDVVCVVPDVARNSAGKYINKPVLTDVDGKKLAVNKDYEIVSYKAKGAVLPKSGAELAVGDEITVELKGKGAYAGQSDAEAVITVTYKVKETDFSKAKITITPQSYTGKAVTLTKDDITVKVGGLDVAQGDYEILPGSYINNVKKGTAQVTLVGRNGYGGAKTVKFKIGARRFEWVWRFFSK